MIVCALPLAWIVFLGARSAAQAPGLAYVEITGSIASLQLDGGFLEIEAGDLDGDGNPDLVSVGDHGSPFINTQQHGVTAWLGDGHGGWTLLQTGDFGYGGCALGDADGDGLMDIAYGVHHNYSSTDLGDQLIEVALGDGSGAGWTPWDDGLATSGETYGMFGTDFGDVDADGDLDLGSTSFGCCSGVHVYANQRDGTWVQSFGFLGGNSDSRFEFADVDGDGDLDGVAGSSSGTIWLGDGAGGFTLADGNLPAGHYIGACAGDVDADGLDELAFVSGGAARVFAWGAGNQWTDKTSNLAQAGLPAVQEIAFGDMDADGRAELLAFNAGSFAICSLQPNGSWRRIGAGTTAGSGTKTGELLRAGADLDHNGMPDLWVVQREPAGSFNTRNVHRVLAESSAPTELAIEPLLPQNGRVWRGGQVRFVHWASAVPSGVALGTVTLVLSTNDGAGPYTVLAAGLPNSGRAQITVPSGISSASCRIVYVLTTPALGRRRATGPRFSIVP
jgi:FG-GAP-like repeat